MGKTCATTLSDFAVEIHDGPIQGRWVMWRGPSSSVLRHLPGKRCGMEPHS